MKIVEMLNNEFINRKERIEMYVEESTVLQKDRRMLCDREVKNGGRSILLMELWKEQTGILKFSEKELSGQLANGTSRESEYCAVWTRNPTELT